MLLTPAAAPGRGLLAPMLARARLGGALALLTSAALGQSPDNGRPGGTGAVVMGRVAGADGAALPGALVTLVGGADSGTTGDSGGFVLRDVGPRSYVLSVRKVGYQPFRRLITVSQSGPTDLAVALLPSVHTLSTVVTTSSLGTAYHRVGLDVRMRGGLGEFLTYDQIRHRQASVLSQLLESFTGYHAGTDAYAGGASQATGLRRAGECTGLLIDGVRQSMSNARDADEMVPIEDIAAIEFYRAGEVPPEWADVALPADTMPQVRHRYSGQPSASDSAARIPAATPPASCSVALIWTRARLGMGMVETQTDRSVTLETSRGRFAGSPGGACDLGVAADTAAFVIYGILEGGESGDDRWSRFADSVLQAVRRSFALPSDLPLPAFGYPFRAVVTDTGSVARPPGSAGVGMRLFQVAPAPSGVAVFTLDSAGGLSETHIAASSLSGAADTSVLAAIQGAAAARAFPRFPAARSAPTIRFDLAFSTVRPGADDRSAVLGRLETPVFPMARAVALDSGPQPSLRPPAGASRPAHDSTTLAFVVDEHGHAVIRTARVLGGPAPGTDPAAYRAFVSQVAHALPQFTFRPGVVGTCPVPQLILQAFVY